MRSDGVLGFTDAQSAALAEAAQLLQRGMDAAAQAAAMITTALARGGRVAEDVASSSDARVREHDMALRAIAAELAGILRQDDRTVQRRIGDARELTELYPRTFEAGRRNEISERHQRLILDLGAALPSDERVDFETAAIAVCREDTPGRVKGRLEMIAARLHPRTLSERHREARDARNVRVIDLGEGMSDLIATLPTVLAHAVCGRLTAQGRAIADTRTRDRSARDGTAGAAPAGTSPEPVLSRLIPSEVTISDARTLDQVRADVLADILLTAAPDADPTRTDDGPGTLGAIRARVQVVVPALTLLGADDGPVDLVGRSPIDADTARALLGATKHPIERILTDPVTGSVIEVDTYERPASLDRYLRARDQRCRFPGCRMPAVRCEVDHNHDAARGGRTCRRNLCHLCQRHHSMKQFTAWKVRPLEDGLLEWTSPLGRVYIDRPPMPVTFVPDPEPGRAFDPPGADRTTPSDAAAGPQDGADAPF
ncbi:HNH endonuclease signature motif containing protein [Microbacterium sp. BK668]|uniref:HNH endonuclease n=1 Tax=Microbacterium sp. BK668 TaxID=2512118 RepID=UPI001AAE0065|nr:HNH endonuclease signature motif containing protein [Microbacterium sp. BK668]